MQVGRTKDQGLYNKPSTAVRPEALAAGTLPQYNTIPNGIKPEEQETERSTSTNTHKVNQMSTCIDSPDYFCVGIDPPGLTLKG